MRRIVDGSRPRAWQTASSLRGLLLHPVEPRVAGVSGMRRPEGHPALAMLCRYRQGPRSESRDRERHPGALDAAGQRPVVRRLEHVSGVAAGRLAQHHIERSGEVLEARRPLGEGGSRSAERRRVPAGPAGPDAELEPAAADLVDGHDVFGKQGRVTEVGAGDERAEAQRRRAFCGSSQQWNGAQPGAVTQRAPAQVVVGPRRVEATLLRFPPARAGLLPRQVRKDHDADAQAHGRNASDRRADDFRKPS